MSVSDARLGQITSRFAELEARLASGTLEGADFVAASRDYAELEPVARVAEDVMAMRGELASLTAMGDSDPEMRALAEEEAARIREELPDAEHRLSVAMLPRDSADVRPAMLEIRAGTGGDEAALFAADLFRMYEGYAATQGWRVEVDSINANDLGGFKEVIASVSGTGVFAQLKFESGVHRVQRVPVTESGGRIHTSAATVAVLPVAEEIDVEIEDKDLKIDIYRASGAGGQHVNTTDSAVRLTHLPTGLVVIQQDQRSQHKNKAKAMQVLRTRLYDLKRGEAQGEEAEARKAMVGSGDRSERIRTYNFPQGRVTDHRINLTLHRLPEILEGPGLGELIDALIAEDQAKRLAAMDGVNISDALRGAAERLAASSDTPRLDAELLMAHALGVSRSDLLLRHMRAAVPDGFAALVERRMGHEPVAYIMGQQEFFGLTLRVTPDVLIPRGDSEVLVEAALAARGDACTVLDCGTGSGALLLAVLAYLPRANGVGIDRSPTALAVAEGNAAAVGVHGRARFLERDWTRPGWSQGFAPFDLILANPPYVEADAQLAPSVAAHEPAGALYAGPEGLDDYRVLLPQLPGLLAPGGVALLEIGAAQADPVTAIAQAAGFAVLLHRDLAGRARVLELKIPLGKAPASA